MSVADLLYEYYGEMRECEEENEMMSQGYVVKLQTVITNEYEEKILAHTKLPQSGKEKK